MRPEKNPLDLNNFPEDFSSRDGKQAPEDTSSSAGYRKKKSGAKESKDESGKVYECRFCSLKFCKSQALGGHMNRHRQERETETLNRARQLVFSNDNLIPQPPPPPQLGKVQNHDSGPPMVHGGYHQPGSITDPTLQFRSVYAPRLFSGTSTTILPPASQSYMYPTQSRILSYSSQHPPQPMNDYFVGHVVPANSQYGLQHSNCSAAPPESTNYTCIGAPVGQGFVHSNGNVRGPPDMVVSGSGGSTTGGGGGDDGRDMSLQNQQRMNLSPINRYQDGF